MKHSNWENEGLIGSEIDKLMEPLRKTKPSPKWISGKAAIAALNHKLRDKEYEVRNSEVNIMLRQFGVDPPAIRPILRTIYISDLQVGEEFFIDDNENNVFVNRDYPYIVHILVLCKTMNKIYPKWISLSIFWYEATEYVEGSRELSMDNLKVYNKEAWLKYISETFSGKEREKQEYVCKYFFDSNSKLPFRIYPATNDKNDVYNEIHLCGTNLELWNKIKGKCLKVMKVTPVFTFDPQVHLSTRVKVPAFSFVDKDIDKEIMKEHHYKPEYFFGDYRIVVDIKEKKCGIKNLKTGKMVVPCEFGDISYQSFYNAKYVNSPITVVSFFKDGLQAMCKANDLEKLTFKHNMKKKR